MTPFFTPHRRCPICDTLWYEPIDTDTENYSDGLEEVCPDCRSGVYDAIVEFDDWEEFLEEEEEEETEDV